MSVRTCAVIVTHRHTDATIECVASLSVSDVPVRAVIIDDRPPDLALQHLPTMLNVEMLRPREGDIGFSRGCNLGIEWVMRNTDCEFILLLHNDTLVRPDTVAFLESTMDENPDVGLATGYIVFKEDLTKLYYGRGSISWPSGGSRVPGFGKSTMDKKVLRYGALRSGPVSFAPECTMLLRREVLEIVGGLDETFIAYEGGVDLSLRVSKAGYALFYCPEAVIVHSGHVTARGNKLVFHDPWSSAVPGYDLRIYHVIRNSIINARKHARGHDRLAFLTLYPMFVLWKALKASRKLGFHAFGPVWKGLSAGLKAQGHKARRW